MGKTNQQIVLYGAKTGEAPKTLSQQFYAVLDTAIEHFNQSLFAGELPQCMITLQRSKRTAGYFSPARWVGKGDNSEHELALNPALITSGNLMELLQTIVHEQCHLWQHEFGKPSRSGYHNSDFRNKMISVGLMPSSTGRPGGKQTGQKMADYPIYNGMFNKACLALMENGFELPLFDRFAGDAPAGMGDTVALTDSDDPQLVAMLLTPVNEYINGLSQAPSNPSPSKTKYHCGDCGVNVWGKPGLDLLCRPCNKPLIVV